MSLSKIALKKAGIFSRHNYGELSRYLKSSASSGEILTGRVPVGILGESLQARRAWQRAVSEFMLLNSEKWRRVPEQVPVMKRNWTIRDLLNLQSYHGQMIGVEIEKFIPRNFSAGLLNRGRRFIELTSDGSINPPSGYMGLESRLVFVRGVSEDRLVKYCECLNQSGAKVNASCGLHIHLDQRGVNRSTAWRRYHRLVEALPWLKMCVSPSRIGNTYCKLNTIGATAPDDRYFAVNWTAYAEHQTIEVRLFNGTTDSAKMLHWVNLCVASSENSLPTLDSMLNCSAIPASSKLWYLERRRKFYGDVGGGSGSDSIEDSER